MVPRLAARSILQATTMWSRRRVGVTLAVLGLAAGIGSPTPGSAKKHKKKKKKCKPACTGGATCQKRQCVCPTGTVTCDDACLAPERVCGEVCCPIDLECFAEGCACEDFLCNCVEERTFCSTPDFTQCCAAGDACDPVAACTTETCTAENDVCTVGAAFCGAGEGCLCTTSQAGDPFCADFQAVDACPATSACSTDDDCAADETCANVSCCGDGDAFFGLCLPACGPPLRATVTTDRSRERQRLQRVLHLDIGWSQRYRR